jgi:anti-sigma regulatory factor (Ser/Thr protein kinase)
MDWEGPFGPDGNSVAAARRFAQARFERVTPRCLADLLLVVSELATNAVMHARTPFSVGLNLGGGMARVEVVDGAPELPSERSLALSTSNGRGLLIVATLADEWGVDWHPDTKTVWAELSVTLANPLRFGFL